MSAAEMGQKHISLAPWFALPNTHTLVLYRDDSEDLATCLIAMLGLLKGLQLVPDGSGHFYRTPIEVSKLADFRSQKSACERVLQRTREYWLATPAIRKRLFGAIHWHLFGPTYEHSFEQFGVAYSVLDTCWRIHAEVHGIAKRTLHAERPVELCQAYGLAVPHWVQLQGRTSPLADLRNEYLHESLWGGEPIGFSHPQVLDAIHLELFWFNARLLLALVGERSEYTRSTLHGQEQLLR